MLFLAIPAGLYSASYDIIGDSVITGASSANANFGVMHASVSRRHTYVGLPGDKIVAWWFYGYSDGTLDTISMEVWELSDSLWPTSRVGALDVRFPLPQNNFNGQWVADSSDTLDLQEGVLYTVVAGCAASYGGNQRVWYSIDIDVDSATARFDSTECPPNAYDHNQFFPYSYKFYGLVRHAPPPPTKWGETTFGPSAVSGRKD